MNSMRYKGYVARIEFDGRDEIFIGRILGIRDIISFHANTVDALRCEFHAAVEDYLRDCAEHGLTPEKPASGKVMLRIEPDVHAAASIAAKAAGKSLNQWANAVFANAAQV